MPKLNEKHSNAHVSSSSPPLCFTLLVMTAAMSLVDEVVATTRRSFFRWETFGSSKARQKLSELLLAMEKREKDNGANTDLLQERLVAEIFRSPLQSRFPVDCTFAASFAKKLALELEEAGFEVEPDIYEVAASSTVNLQKRFYKSYFLGEDEKVAISLCESAEFLAGGGTTGLRTWEAAEVLLDWCWKKKTLFKNRRRVLELGSGAGFFGIGAIKLGLIDSKMTFSDCHAKVLENLRHNCRENLGPEGKEYKVAAVDWTNFQLDQIEDTDLVVASDVVFDPVLVPSLACTLQEILRPKKTREGPKAEAFIACKVRNESTLELFEHHLRDGEQGLKLCQEEIRVPDGTVRLYTIS